MAEQETYYEMLWDCETCATKGLLGTSHRHCPQCGAAQDPARRYFPPVGEEVEARNHVYVGVDWNCAYCQSPNSAAAKCCVNCGAGRDGAKPVLATVDAPVAEPPVVPVVPVVPAKRHFGRWLAAALGIAMLILIGMFFTTRETAVEITGHAWERRIAIERYSAVSEDAWCDSLPSGAYAVSRSREVRSQRQVEAGQDCIEKRVDMGDGSFTKKRECTPRYRDEPVYDERCHFRVNRWQVARQVVANQDSAPNPTWPLVGHLQGGSALGAEREAGRRERYILNLAGAGKTWQCDVDAALWERLRDGSQVSLGVRLTGGADCGSLR